ncbi:MAG: hypothetical protein V5804_04060 [Mucilaginibacter sp.]|uniref:hypothetical protein n=1 Tax=Mucilaginibacter sp. TaxID=1882438 RepID=UPI0034E50E73
MDTRKHSISYASFINKTYRWSIAYLHRKRAFKHVALLSVVLFCTLTRYVVLSFDKNEVRQTQAKPGNFKLLKLPLVRAKTILKSEVEALNQKHRHKTKSLNFKNAKSNSFYIYALN